MKQLTQQILGVIVVGSLTACATPYQPKAGEPTARVNINTAGSVSICSKGQRYSVSPAPGEHYAVFPANTAVSVFAHRVVGGGYQVTYTCSPQTGVRPEAGKTYFLNFEMEESKCRLEFYEENNKSPAGLLPILPGKAEPCS